MRMQLRRRPCCENVWRLTADLFGQDAGEVLTVNWIA